MGLLATVLIGLWGNATLTALPKHTVQISVDEGLPWGITQANVDAAVAEEPVRSWQPLTLRVTDEFFTYDQQSRQQETEQFGADLVLSIQPDDLTSGLDFSSQDRSGVAAHPDMPRRWSETDGPGRAAGRLYANNLSVGRGPSGVVATARDMGESTYTGAPRVPAAWAAGTAGTGALTLLTAVVWVRLRRRESEVRRAFQRAQADLSRVLLEEDALELTLVAVPDRDQTRTPGFQRLRTAVQKGATALVRREREIADGLRSTERSTWSDAADDVPPFAADTRTLADQAEALLAAGEALIGSPGGQRVLDRVAEPMVTAARSLQATLRSAPPGTVQPGRLEELDQAVQALLAVVQAEASMDTSGISPQGRGRWDKAEQRITGAARGIVADLERFPLGHGVEPHGRDGVVAEEAHLRSGLGLTVRQDGGASRALRQAHATAWALLGTPDPVDHPGQGASATEEPHQSPRSHARGGKSRRTSRAAGRRRPGDRGVELAAGILRRGGQGGLQGIRLTGRGWFVAALLSLLIAQPLAAGWAEQATPYQTWKLDGREAISSLVIDGPDLGISPDRVLEQINGRFSEQLDVIVAVRAAEAYVSREPVDEDLDTGRSVRVEAPSLVDGLERIRSEFPDRLDATTGELLPGQVIVPIFVWEDGRRSVAPTQLGSPLIGGRGFSAQRLSGMAWEESRALDGAVATALVDAGRDLQTDREDLTDDLSEESLALLLTVMLATALVALVALLESLASFAWGLRGIGSLGRSGRRLRTVRRELGQLLLELDRTRLDRVAVLGAGPAGSPQEAEQRLYERALDSAWRDAEDLGNLTIGQRLRGQAEPRLDRLEQAVALLEDRDSDVAGRASRLLSLDRR